jgi:hypothetical protein
VSQTDYKMVMIALRTEDDSIDRLSHKIVANMLDPMIADRISSPEGWVVEGAMTPQLDVDTLASLIDDANLTGEQTVELMGRITAHSINRAIQKLGPLADALQEKGFKADAAS